MKFMPIVPISCMDLLDEWDSLFALPDLMLNRVYRNYVSSRGWNTIILDNGYYELGASLPVKFLELMINQLVGDQGFVVGEETQNALETYVMNFKHQEYGTWNKKLMVIVKDPDIYISYPVYGNICLLSKQAPHEGKAAWYADRIEAVERIRKQFTRAYIHCLGCDTIEELESLREAGADSVDSSFPCSRAVAEVGMNEPSERIDLWGSYTEEQKDAMRKNLEKIMLVI